MPGCNSEGENGQVFVPCSWGQVVKSTILCAKRKMYFKISFFIFYNFLSQASKQETVISPLAEMSSVAAPGNTWEEMSVGAGSWCVLSSQQELWAEPAPPAPPGLEGEGETALPGLGLLWGQYKTQSGSVRLCRAQPGSVGQCQALWGSTRLCGAGTPDVKHLSSRALNSSTPPPGLGRDLQTGAGHCSALYLLTQDIPTLLCLQY